MAEWLKALVSKTGIPFTGYRGFESPFFRRNFLKPSLTLFREGFLFPLHFENATKLLIFATVIATVIFICDYF